MIGLWGRWPIWGMRSRIKRSAMFCNATVYRPRRSASTRPPGRHSFGLTWRCWRGPTSSRRRSSRYADRGPCVYRIFDSAWTQRTDGVADDAKALFVAGDTLKIVRLAVLHMLHAELRQR